MSAINGPFVYVHLEDHPLGTNAINDARGRTVARFESWVPREDATRIARQLTAYRSLVETLRSISTSSVDSGLKSHVKHQIALQLRELGEIQ